MYSPELETLDQLCGGNMALAIVRGLFGDADHFRKATLAMLHERDVILMGTEAAIERSNTVGRLSAFAHRVRSETHVNPGRMEPGPSCWE
jgi:hypothetical protein